MSRGPDLEDRLTSLRARGEGALVPFVTGGDPSLDALPALLEALEEGGADAIEVGLPFSDPIADGPVIQASSQRALERGATPSAVLERISAFTARSNVPVIVMGYLNPVLRRGYDSFADDLLAAGVGGAIVSDLVPDEAGPWVAACRARGIATVFLAAPTSTESRLDRIAELSTGFVYVVSRTGVTGAHSGALDEVRALVESLRVRTRRPLCVGFGIRSSSDVAQVCRIADGAIVGSAIVERVAREWDLADGAARLTRFVHELKAATRS